MPTNSKPTAADQRERTANAQLLCKDFKIEELTCPGVQKPLQRDLGAEIMRRDSKVKPTHWSNVKCLLFLYKQTKEDDDEEDKLEDGTTAAATTTLGKGKKAATPSKITTKTTTPPKIAEKSEPPPLTPGMVARVIMSMMRDGANGLGPDLLMRWNANASRAQKCQGGSKGKEQLCDYIVKNFNDITYNPDSPKAGCAMLSLYKYHPDKMPLYDITADQVKPIVTKAISDYSSTKYKMKQSGEGASGSMGGEFYNYCFYTPDAEAGKPKKKYPQYPLAWLLHLVLDGQDELIGTYIDTFLDDRSVGSSDAGTSDPRAPAPNKGGSSSKVDSRTAALVTALSAESTVRVKIEQTAAEIEIEEITCKRVREESLYEELERNEKRLRKLSPKKDESPTRHRYKFLQKKCAELDKKLYG